MDTEVLISRLQRFFQHKYKYNYAWKTMITVLVFVYTLSLQNHVTGEVYSSASDMKNIFRMEMDLADSLSEYAKKTQAKLDRVNKYIEVVSYELINLYWFILEKL